MLKKEDPKTGRKIAIGALVAGIGGYVAGLLTAPKSGKQTRAELADDVSAAKNNAEVQLAIAQRDLGVLIKEAQEKTLALSAQAREEFNETLIRAKDAQNKAKMMLKAVKTGSGENPELDKAVKQAKQAQKNLSKFLKS